MKKETFFHVVGRLSGFRKQTFNHKLLTLSYLCIMGVYGTEIG